MKMEDYNEYYIQGSDHYLIPKDVFKELFNEMSNWREEVKELQNNWNELTKWVIEQEQKAWDEVSSTFGYVLNKMQELQGDDKN